MKSAERLESVTGRQMTSAIWKNNLYLLQRGQEGVLMFNSIYFILGQKQKLTARNLQGFPEIAVCSCCSLHGKRKIKAEDDVCLFWYLDKQQSTACWKVSGL